MIPRDGFTPHGYLDNPFHSWKVNPSGVLRSLPPLGMGWHVPNLGSYAHNQFQYTAHLQIALKIEKTILVTPEDFRRHKCTIVSHLHTKNRFEYTCAIPKHRLTLTARYFLVNEHALGCILMLSATTKQPLPVTCYLIHQHTHNPHTSRLWEHGLYAMGGPQDGVCMLGIASEGDVFVHGARSADGEELAFGEMGYTIALEDAAIWIHGASVPRPGITEHEESTGWQVRSVILPCHLTLAGDDTAKTERVINAVLARGISQDQAYQRWIDGIEEIALAETNHRADDEQFWNVAPQLAGDWPESWRRGLVYDLETLRMVIRPSEGIIDHPFDGMQIQAPRLVLAEAAMDVLFLSYADPELAAEVILGHFESAPHPNLPCMREDGSYNMVADDGQICGTAPPWGHPVWCCDLLWHRTGDVRWLRRLYPRVAAYLRWWLAHRRDAEGWLVYACSWESGQDVSSRFGPQQTGGTIIQHVRPVDLQASMAQSAGILARWATTLAQNEYTPQPLMAEIPIDFSQEATEWRKIADEFTAKTRQMWQSGWFHDYDTRVREWSSQQDTMHLTPVFCGLAEQERMRQLATYFKQPPQHSGWAPLSWPPVAMTLIEAATLAHSPLEAAEMAYRFIDASYRSTDSRKPDEHGGLPGVTREYLQAVATGKWDMIDYVNAGIEGYGWGALSIHLLVRYLLGLREEEAHSITICPMFPQALRRQGTSYRIEKLSWGSYLLDVECHIKGAQQYTIRVYWRARPTKDALLDTQEDTMPAGEEVHQSEWEAQWGETRFLRLSS
jgi:hypothetical protein